MTARRAWLAVIVAAAVVRLCTLSAYPLHDTTEARYAEIARLMVLSNDWITPQIEPGVPFWAKPPLSTWLTAASYKLLGLSEFAARLPAFLLMALTVWLVFRLARRCYSEKAALAAAAISLTSALGFVAAGAVMTDAALALATTISLTSFCATIRQSGPGRRYGLFIGIGFGLLAKGPLAIVLVGLPVFIWTVWYRSLPWLWRALPWPTGMLLMLAIAGPWYLLAEMNSPGFLRYFLVGEHILRFIDSGWPGDLYGQAHARPRGTIWIYAIAAMLPWSVPALVAVGHWLRAKPDPRNLDPTQSFLLLWLLTPMTFFTLAGNILPAYVLPALPAFAVLLGNWLPGRSTMHALGGLMVPALVAIAGLSGAFDRINSLSQRDLVAYHGEAYPAATLYFFPSAPYSATFYSRGTVREIQSEPALDAFISTNRVDTIAIRDKVHARLPKDLSGCLRPGMRVHRYVLVRPGDRCQR